MTSKYWYKSGKNIWRNNYTGTEVIIQKSAIKGYNVIKLQSGRSVGHTISNFKTLKKAKMFVLRLMNDNKKYK